jgi:hypothetical protein
VPPVVDVPVAVDVVPVVELFDVVVPIAAPPFVVVLLDVTVGVVPVDGVVVPDDGGLGVPDSDAVLVVGVVVEDGPEFVNVLELVVGTVSCGAPLVFVVAGPPVPHAPIARAAQIAERATIGPRERRWRKCMGELWCRGARPLAGQRVHLLPAMRADVQVLLRELIAVVAEAQILNGPRQLRRSRGQREQLGNDLEPLAGLSIDVLLVRVGLDDDLSSR